MVLQAMFCYSLFDRERNLSMDLACEERPCSKVVANSGEKLWISPACQLWPLTCMFRSSGHWAGKLLEKVLLLPSDIRNSGWCLLYLLVAGTWYHLCRDSGVSGTRVPYSMWTAQCLCTVKIICSTHRALRSGHKYHKQDSLPSRKNIQDGDFTYVIQCSCITYCESSVRNDYLNSSSSELFSSSRERSIL